MPPEVAAPAPWALAAHILGVIAYAGGLLTVLHVLSRSTTLPPEGERDLAAEARRAYLAVTTPAGGLMLLAGLWMLLGDPGWAAYKARGWMHAKITMVVLLLVVDHVLVLRPMKRAARGEARGDAAGRRTLYGLGRAAVLLLVAGIVLAVFLPRG